ncbi:MAG: maltotransferase domain-containing protein, partial [Gemmatimonadota bacterium]
MSPPADWRRVVIEGVAPEVDAGRFPVKRIAGERVVVEADIFADGHDALACVLRHRRAGDGEWAETPMALLGNDRWRAEFRVGEPGRHAYTIEAWVDRFETWRHGLAKKVAAEQDVAMDLRVGAELVERGAARATGADAKRLEAWAKALHSEKGPAGRIELALGPELAETMARHPDRAGATRYGKELAVVVDRERARFGTWYEMFPRSCAPEPRRHGTFRDAEARLEYVASMGFDVLYLPPIHPIGRTERKGKNGAVAAKPGEPGSPWGIGAAEGGHTAVHPELGTLEDFRRFLAKAQEHGLEVALDIAFQCSPDHPWVKEHPEWFRRHPDGAIQYAENPPKKYQDIYPLEFENEDWRALWETLRDVFLFWIEQGVRIFRVDNPHTKPFDF